MANQVTVTGKTAGAETVTSKVIPCTKVTFDMAAQVLRIYNAETLLMDIGLDSITTVTCTVATNTFAFTCS